MPDGLHLHNSINALMIKFMCVYYTSFLLLLVPWSEAVKAKYNHFMLHDLTVSVQSSQ